MCVCVTNTTIKTICSVRSMGVRVIKCWFGLVWFGLAWFGLVLLLLGGHSHFGLTGCSTPLPASTNTGLLFVLKYLLHCKGSPAHKLWWQEKEIRLESTCLSSEPRSAHWVLEFSLPHTRSKTHVELCFGMEVC